MGRLSLKVVPGSSRDEIVGWLEEEAEERGLLFSRTVAALAVMQAIRNSRRREPEPGADES